MRYEHLHLSLFLSPSSSLHFHFPIFSISPSTHLHIYISTYFHSSITPLHLSSSILHPPFHISISPSPSLHLHLPSVRIDTDLSRVFYWPAILEHSNLHSPIRILLKRSTRSTLVGTRYTTPTFQHFPPTPLPTYVKRILRSSINSHRTI
jgi:hypothetical protein